MFDAKASPKLPLVLSAAEEFGVKQLKTLSTYNSNENPQLLRISVRPAPPVSAGGIPMHTKNIKNVCSNNIELITVYERTSSHPWKAPRMNP